VDATTPLARPMLAVLGQYYRSCVLVVNREEAPVWEMYQDEMRCPASGYPRRLRPMISNTRVAVPAYAEAITGGIQDR